MFRARRWHAGVAVLRMEIACRFVFRVRQVFVPWGGMARSSWDWVHECVVIGGWTVVGFVWVLPAKFGHVQRWQVEDEAHADVHAGFDT